MADGLSWCLLTHQPRTIIARFGKSQENFVVVFSLAVFWLISWLEVLLMFIA
jgi:hypothetical protein